MQPILPDSTGAQMPVLKVEAPRSLFVHRSPGGYLHRVGSARRQMSPELLARLFKQRSQTRMIRFDEQCVADARVDDLAPELWRPFAGPNARDTDENILTKLGLARADEDGLVRPTVTGILMAADDPRPWLPNAFVQAVAYRGKTAVGDGDRNYQIDAADYCGPLDSIDLVPAVRELIAQHKRSA